jgi:hypothetical protein
MVRLWSLRSHQLERTLRFWQRVVAVAASHRVRAPPPALTHLYTCPSQPSVCLSECHTSAACMLAVATVSACASAALARRACVRRKLSLEALSLDSCWWWQRTTACTPTRPRGSASCGLCPPTPTRHRLCTAAWHHWRWGRAGWRTRHTRTMLRRRTPSVAPPVRGPILLTLHAR